MLVHWRWIRKNQQEPLFSYFLNPTRVMDYIILTLHSLLRYFVLLFMIVLIVRSFLGWRNKSAFGSLDDRLSLWIFALAHSQLLLGVVLYAISPRVIFSGESMKDPDLRYWLVEHASMMIIAITLITIGRISVKKTTEQVLKHKKLFIYNLIALLIILAAIAQSGRGFFSLPS